MSRFNNWTAAAVLKVQFRQSNQDAEIAKSLKLKYARNKKKPQAEGSTGKLTKSLVGALNAKLGILHHADMIGKALCSLNIKHEREYKFAKKRKFRFDYAFPEHKIAVEYEGGIYSRGRHTRALGYARDAEKYNLALKLGWKVLRYTTADTKIDNWEYAVVEDVLSEINKCKGELNERK
jgi:very-short-patch-repair endonuclease